MSNKELPSRPADAAQPDFPPIPAPPGTPSNVSTPFNTAPSTPLNTVPPITPLCSPPLSVHNVVLFGETGVGKSSVVNMLLGERKAQTSTGARGCTFTSVPYDLDLGDGVSVRVHDTAGLDEGSAGTVSPENAVANLYELILKMKDGISLLVFVTRLGRITERNQKNYRLFYEGICQNRVPIVLVVTHGEDACDDDDDNFTQAMDRWLDCNERHFQRNGMTFDRQAVIIAAKRGYQKEYEKSTQKVRDLVRSTYLRPPWKMEGLDWACVVIRYYFSLFGWAMKSHLLMLIQALSTYGHDPKEISNRFQDPAAVASAPRSKQAAESCSSTRNLIDATDSQPVTNTGNETAWFHTSIHNLVTPIVAPSNQPTDFQPATSGGNTGKGAAGSCGSTHDSSVTPIVGPSTDSQPVTSVGITSNKAVKSRSSTHNSVTPIVTPSNQPTDSQPATSGGNTSNEVAESCAHNSVIPIVESSPDSQPVTSDGNTSNEAARSRSSTHNSVTPFVTSLNQPIHSQPVTSGSSTSDEDAESRSSTTNPDNKTTPKKKKIPRIITSVKQGAQKGYAKTRNFCSSLVK